MRILLSWVLQVSDCRHNASRHFRIRGNPGGLAFYWLHWIWPLVSLIRPSLHHHIHCLLRRPIALWCSFLYVIGNCLFPNRSWTACIASNAKFFCNRRMKCANEGRQLATYHSWWCSRLIDQLPVNLFRTSLLSLIRRLTTKV